MTSDPFEEFEFKPLTEGLGFHKKTAKPANNPLNSPKSNELFKNRGLDLIESETSPLQSPLPRKTYAKEDGRLSPHSSAVDEVLKTFQQRPATKATTPQAQTLNKVKSQGRNEDYAPDVISFSAFFLDGLLILAASLLCMILLLTVTKVDLLANLARPDKEGFIYLSTALVFAGVAFIYYLTNRAFLGYTPGEWAYDQRLGTPQDLFQTFYPVKIILRWVLIALTGFITLPLISKIMGRDLVGEWTGTPLVRKI